MLQFFTRKVSQNLLDLLYKLRRSQIVQKQYFSLNVQKDSKIEKQLQSLFLQGCFDLQQFLIFKSESEMSNQRDNKISSNDFSKTTVMPQQTDKTHLNFFQNLKILSSSNINSDSFPCLNSLFLSENGLEQYNLPLFTRISRRQSDNQSFFEDQSQVQVLTFGRCYSEDFHPDDKLLMIESDRFYEGQLGNEVVSAIIPENLKISAPKGETAHDQSGQELQSNSINSQSINNSDSPQQSLCTGLMVKNVTKNIGKLLFKYIWKNRIALKRAVLADEVVWQKLMCMIRECKKQNNVTREFLLSRFHSEGEECRLFRVLAHHFFRKHCLGAIFRSKIKSKRIHFQRIRKFNQALTNHDVYISQSFPTLPYKRIKHQKLQQIKPIQTNPKQPKNSTTTDSPNNSISTEQILQQTKQSFKHDRLLFID